VPTIERVGVEIAAVIYELHVGTFTTRRQQSWQAEVTNCGYGRIDFGGYLMLFALSGGSAGELSVPGMESALVERRISLRRQRSECIRAGKVSQRGDTALAEGKLETGS
jgi:hypothetical protein